MAYGETVRDVTTVGRLSPDQLTRRCAADTLPFDTTEQFGDGAEIIGQQRAIDALGFGIAIGEEGYNLFAMGSEGMGRRTLTRRFLDGAAATKPVPSDWCYVFNFHVPHRRAR